MFNESNILLTLAIPTYNRAAILDRALKIIQPQLASAKYPVEFIVSDNASPDNTREVVQKYIDAGMPIRYIRNQQNVGPADNILQCYKIGKGKYVWVIGDDDYLTDTALDYILSVLNNTNEYGVIYCCLNSSKNGYKEYTNKKNYLLEMGYWISFISAIIINKKYIDIFDFNNHKEFWVSVIFIIDGIVGCACNVSIYEKIFSEAGIDGSNNGGYNYFEVFIEEFLSTWKKYGKKVGIGWLVYEKLKYRLFREHIIIYTYVLLFRHRKTNFKTEHAWYYLFKYYWYEPYFYVYIALYFIRGCLWKLKNKFLIGKF
jgi:glycosyltransferase involved in cell wall biosynthesis